MHPLKKRLYSWDSLMIFLLLFQCIYYGFQNIIFLEPQSLHIWRQSDCASFAWYYATQTWNFFTPGVNNMAPNATGEVATEFPIIYYISGMIYRLIGIQPIVHRFINISITLFGLFSLYRLLDATLRNKFWAIVIPMFIFTCPIFVFYSNNFLPDVPAASLCMAAVYYFYRYSQTKNLRHYRISIALFLLAPLLKFSYSLVFIALICLFALERIPIAKRIFIPQQSSLFHQATGKHILSFALVFVGLFSWYIYASWYSTQTVINHFGSIVSPAYGESFKDFTGLFEQISRKIQEEFFYHSSSIFLIKALALGLLLGFGKAPRLLRISFALLVLGTCAYLSNFLKLSLGHTYYMLPFLLAVIPVSVYGAHLIERYIQGKRANQLIKAGVILFLVLNLYHAKSQMQIRYYGRTMNYRENLAFYKPEFRDYLNKLGIDEETKIISYPDPSMNNTLYLMRRKGWSSLGIKRIHTTFVTHLKNEGAKYLILGDTLFRNDSLLMPALQQKVGAFEGVDIYDISYLHF